MAAGPQEPVLDAAPQTWSDVQDFAIAPPQPGEWTYDPTAWVHEHDRPALSMEARMRNAGDMVGRMATLPLGVAALLGNEATQSFGQAVTAPQRIAAIQQQYGGDWYAAGHDPRMAAEALNFAGALSLGPIGARAATMPVRMPNTSLLPSPVLARSAEMFDFPTQSQRPFSADYPRYAGNEHLGQRLAYTIEWTPILPDSRIVGRGTGGGGDVAYDPAGYDAIAEATTGQPIATVSPIQWPPEQLGVTYRNADGTPRRIEIADDITAASIDYLRAHEVSHAMDFATAPQGRRLPLNLEQQLRRIYNDGNNPDRSMVGRPAYINGNKPRPAGVVSPETRGYEPLQVESELWADAGRAYLTNPNYIKTVAPDVAAILRQSVNNHPVLSRVITFNAGGIPVPVGGPLPGTLQQVRLPGGAPVARLPDLLGQAMLTTPPVVRPPLGPAWAAEYHAAYQDPNSPQWAARMALEAQQQAAQIAAERQESARRSWEQATLQGRAV